MTRKTPLFDWHQTNGGKMIDYAGWRLPINYSSGIIAEHLACRKFGALFDISHMGRFLIRGWYAASALSRALTNDPTRLQPGKCHYTLIADEAGFPLDDAFLYQLHVNEYLLVVNGANREKIWSWLQDSLPAFVQMQDLTEQLAMLSLQGPCSERLLQEVWPGEQLPVRRNALTSVFWEGAEVLVSATGYTGEPLGFEIFVPNEQCPSLWQELASTGREMGIVPVGLGARDTLRLEAGYPLYGHEYQADRPALAVPQAAWGVSLQRGRPDFVGRRALTEQMKELKNGAREHLPKRVMMVVALTPAMIRGGAKVRAAGREVGELTSGNIIPAWRFKGSKPTDETYKRAVGLAYLDREVSVGQRIEIAYRKRRIEGIVVSSLMENAGGYLVPRQLN